MKWVSIQKFPEAFYPAIGGTLIEELEAVLKW
jgi:hypothetical protein